MEAIWLATVKSTPAVTAAWPNRLNQPEEGHMHRTCYSADGASGLLCAGQVRTTLWGGRWGHLSSTKQRAPTQAWRAARSCKSKHI